MKIPKVEDYSDDFLLEYVKQEVHKQSKPIRFVVTV